jgi:hypothetical protein
MKVSFRKPVIVLSAIVVSFLVAIPAYAVLNSSGFLTNAQSYIDGNCSNPGLDNQTSLLCYLFSKSGEQDSKIADLEQRLNNLEATPPPALTPTPTPTLVPTPAPTPTSVPAVAETPWQANEHGSLTTNINTSWLGGYKFVPQVNGQITKLGAFGNGTKTIYLWDDANVGSSTTDNDPVRSVSVVSANNWVYASISPYPVVAGRTYVVATYNLGGGSYRRGTNLPAIYGNIKILHSCIASSVVYPTTCAAGWDGMYGQADIEFVKN